MSFYNNQSVFDRLAAAETESSYRKRNNDPYAHETTSPPSSPFGTFYTSRSNSNTPRSNGTVSSSLFNRLANTETYATASMKGKIPSPPHHNRGAADQRTSRSKDRSSPDASFWHRLAYTETFSTAQLKGMNDQVSQSSNTKRKTSNSFFHRMAYSETFATASKKGLVEDSPKNQTKSPRSKRSNDFFDRMCRTETYASASIKSVYGYGKSQEQPITPRSSRRKYATTDVFDRLSRTDTKSSSLKKSSSWQKREEVSSRYTPRHSRTRSSRKQYLAATNYHISATGSQSSGSSRSPPARRVRSSIPDDVHSIASARSSRSLRSERSAYSSRSNIADYATGRRTPSLMTSSPSQSQSFMSRLSRIDSSSPTNKEKSKPKSSAVKKSSTKTTATTTTTTTTTTTKARSNKPVYTAPRTTAAERLRQEAALTAKKNRINSSSRTSSPARSLKTTTTAASASSYTTSSRREVASLSSRSTTARTTSTVVKKVEPPKPKPPPRPVLQFDSDDDFSYGESEDEDDFDLGDKKKEDEEEKEKEDEKATNPATSTSTSAVAAAAAPQDVLSKSNDRGLALNDEIENTTGAEIEVVLNDGHMTNDGQDDDENPADDGFEQTMSVETASIDDILGNSGNGNDEYDDIVADVDINDTEEAEAECNAESTDDHEKDLMDFDDDNNDINDVKEEEEPVLDDDHEDIEAEVDEQINDIDNVPTEELIPITSTDDNHHLMNGESEDPFEQDSAGIDFMKKEEDDDDDELDDILNEPEPESHAVDNMDAATAPPPPPVDNNDEGENTNPAEEAPVNLIESDDDFSYGDESLEDDDLGHKVDNEAEPENQPEQQEEDNDGEDDQQMQEAKELIDEPPETNEVPEEKDINGSDTMNVDEPSKQDMKKSETLDSLDFLLDASSTINEEPEEEEDKEYSDGEDLDEVGSLDDEMGSLEDEMEGDQFGHNPYDDGSLIESIIEEEDEDIEEEEASEASDDEPDMEDEDAEDTLPPLRYKLLVSDKYHPEYGLEEIYPEDLELVDSLLAFEENAISNHEIAVLIIEALFERDFENGDHWEIDQGTARDLEDDEGGGGDLEGCAFVVKRQARLDWNDLYSVAAAKGTIIISSDKDEIKVENYSYFVAG